MSGIKERYIRHFQQDFNWDEVERMPYKEEGTAPFRSISRQVLFNDPAQKSELRYFEIQTEGFSTLERHQHTHAVMILRGSGHCLIGNEIFTVEAHDLVTIPAWTWHQFRATCGTPLGFLCMVNAERDKPQLPSDAELAAMQASPDLAAFFRGKPSGGETK